MLGRQYVQWQIWRGKIERRGENKGSNAVAVSVSV